MNIWPWSLIRELEATIRLQAREIAGLRTNMELAETEITAECSKRIAAEALAADRRQALEQAREDLATARTDAKEARQSLVNALVEANLRLSTSREEKPPDMNKIREMMPMGGEERVSPMQRSRAIGRDIDRLLMAKFLPGLVAKARAKSAPAVEGPPPGADERPSLGATG